MTLQVIGAGVGRTGTYSLKLALEQLGFGPCYHMEEVFKDAPRRVALWNDAARRQARLAGAVRGLQRGGRLAGRRLLAGARGGLSGGQDRAEHPQR